MTWEVDLMGLVKEAGLMMDTLEEEEVANPGLMTGLEKAAEMEATPKDTKVVEATHMTGLVPGKVEMEATQRVIKAPDLTMDLEKDLEKALVLMMDTLEVEGNLAIMIMTEAMVVDPMTTMVVTEEETIPTTAVTVEEIITMTTTEGMMMMTASW